MDTFKIALLQLLPESTLRGNIEKGISYCRAAKKAGADLALFPEMWSNGYRIGSPADLAEEAVASDGEFLRRFAGCAKELGMAICVTYLEKFSPAPRNSLALFDGRGEKVLDYSKVHTCDFGEERLLAAGDGFRTAELETGEGQDRRHDLLRQGVSRKCARPHAAGCGNHSRPQRLSHGN